MAKFLFGSFFILQIIAGFMMTIFGITLAGFSDRFTPEHLIGVLFIVIGAMVGITFSILLNRLLKGYFL